MQELTSDDSAQNGVVGQIAQYVVAAREQRTPPRAREAAFRCIFDLLGAAGAGFGSNAVLATRKVAFSTMRTGKAPVWFSGQSSSIVGAAWANSAAASALDLDDGHRLARGHPGAAVIPAAFAAAAELGSPMEEVIRAIVIGYEVGVSVGAARLTYGNTGTWSSYAVVATVAALRRTKAEFLEHALAIAGESAPNQLFASAPAQLPPPEGSDVKEGIPWSVVTGLTALSLAEAGHTGPRNILDSATHYNFSKPLALGTSLHICNAYFKLYAACRHVHAPIEALLAVLKRHQLNTDVIDQIAVYTYGGALRISNKPAPENLTDIQYSIPYCLALVAIWGPQILLPLTEDALHHPEATALAQHVTLALDADLDVRFPEQTLARVSISSGNKSFVSEITAPKGEAQNPLSWGELEEKFRSATRFSLAREKQDRIINAIIEDKFGCGRALMDEIADNSTHLPRNQ